MTIEQIKAIHKRAVIALAGDGICVGISRDGDEWLLKVLCTTEPPAGRVPTEFEGARVTHEVIGTVYAQ